jgi:DNA-binding FadR family transcriptional regulator
MTTTSPGTTEPRVTTSKAPRIVTESLRQRILDGEFPIGELLPPAEVLTEDYGVSRPTLREALNTLEADGLVRLRRGRGGGAIAQAPNPGAIIRSMEWLLRFEGTTVEQILEVRHTVDPLAARLAAERADSEELTTIADSVERQGLPEVLGSQEAWFQENLRFHQAIATGAHNPLIRVLFDSLHHIVLTTGQWVPMKRSEREASVKQHRAIYEAIAARHAHEAEHLVRDHLARSLALRQRYPG